MLLECIEGIGPKTSNLFSKLKVNSVEDLIYYYPKKYNVIKRSNMSDVKNGDKVIIDGTVLGVPTIISYSAKLKKIIFRIQNNKNIYNISAYNLVYLCNELKSGDEVTIIGKYDKMKNTIVVSEVRMGGLPDKIVIEPVYQTVSGLNRKNISKYVMSALDSGVDIVDYIPMVYRDKYNFRDKIWSVREIHSPSDVVSYKRAVQRLKYEELFMYMFKVNYFRLRMSNDVNAIERDFNEEEVNLFIEKLPFKLTIDQISCISEVKDDLRMKKRMNRLIQGDVGSGKTIVAFIASYINYLSGYQTALMVPTEILANQHYDDAVKLFRDSDMRICLLTSSISKKRRLELYKKIEEGDIDFVIGTQSLIQEDLIYNKLGLIITDEQHRFGVSQRDKLKSKGMYPDVMSMSATPIPRTYALTIYGDMDVSNIKTKPAGRKEVITCFKKDNNLMEVLEMMKREIDNGCQVYVIAPSIVDDDEDSINNVMKLKEKMEIAFGKICNVGAVHGKLDVEDKNKVMKDFEKGKINILISTTVIEVGVNVPNATMMVIFNANMFGLSTLHQLRGRVGRGDKQGYCVLIASESSERLKMLENCNDGFAISEYDFSHRGEGDLFGIKQSGDVELKLASVSKDFDLLVRVKEDVLEFMRDYLDSDDSLKLKKYCDGMDILD